MSEWKWCDGHRRFTRSAWEYAEVYDMHDRGLTMTEIESLTGIRRSTLRQIVENEPLREEVEREMHEVSA